jgi:SAM-dependent methyltransferase
MIGTSHAMPASPEGSHARAPDYGFDAPGVVRNLLLAAAAGFAIWTLTVTGLWSGILTVGPVGLSFGPMGLITGILCVAMAAWMLWESKVGKVRERERLLDLVPWTGHEHVLDVGCGRGLMLIGAARRLTTGKATGIDLWNAADLSGNKPEATLENCRIENVSDRVEVVTGDMRTLPFPDASFDVVLSSNAIHNLYDASDRDAAIAQIARVLKPGGRVLIVDIRHAGQYERALRAGGCAEVSRRGSALLALGLGILTFGSLRPATLLGRKSHRQP